MKQDDRSRCGPLTGPFCSHIRVYCLAVLVLLSPCIGGVGIAHAQSATYRVTFEGEWTTTATQMGVPVPSGAHFSPLIGAVHNDQVTFWSEGDMASAGIESMAEVGGTNTLKSEINASAHALSVIERGGNIGATGSATVNTVTLTPTHPLVTLVTMVAPSPDWFVGVSGLSLLDAQNEWRASYTVELFPYDAGTEDGTEFSLSNNATDPQGTITSIQGTGKFSSEPIATLTFTKVPALAISTLVSGLLVPWGLAFTPDGTLLFTQRGGTLTSRRPDGTLQSVSAGFGDLFSSGESGLMAIVVDPDFATNSRFYTCQAHTGPEVQVIAWTMNAAYTQATRVNDPLVGGIPLTSGRHGGCRLRFGPDGYLWIATGDAAMHTTPQDLNSLGGKVLRVNASTGAGATGNPFMSAPLVYTYGHRNVQGLARRPGTDQMWTVEHGPAYDDEINLLTAGGNYGWSPGPGYNENVPMTDLTLCDSDEAECAVIEAKWSSGSSRLAPSGGIFLEGSDWDGWEGSLAVASLRDRSLRLFAFTDDGTLKSEIVVPELKGTYGRLRTPMLGPDGALYITTSNSGQDKILRVAPNEPVITIARASGSAITEGSPALFTLTASPAAPLTVNVSIAQSGDFTSATGPQIVTLGTSGSTTFSVHTEDDTIDEPNGSVTARVTSGADYTVGTPSSAVVTVNDDDGGGGGGGGGPTGGGGGGGGGGGATVRDTHGNRPRTATVLPLSPSRRRPTEPGQLVSGRDVDYFRVALPQPGLLWVESRSSLDTRGRLFAADAVLLEEDDNSGARRNFAVATAVEAGEHYIAVDSPRGSTGAYTLAVDYRPGYLGIPWAESIQSGIGVLSGWICEAAEVVLEIEAADGRLETYEAGAGTERQDTAAECGHPDSGYGLLFNWANLAAGAYTVRAVVDGVVLDTHTVTIVPIGPEPFVRGLRGTYPLADFPQGGATTQVVWSEAQQGFVIGAGAITPGPEDTPGDFTRYVLGNPGAGTYQSGVGVLSGWACEAETVALVITPETGEAVRVEAAYGTERRDTREECGDVDNGYGVLFNWNRLGDGVHVVVLEIDGQAVAQSTVRVTTLGAEFVRGLRGTYAVEGFPTPEQTTTIEWQQQRQNFGIVGVE